MTDADKNDKLSSFFTSNGILQSVWRIFTLLLSAMFFIGAAWFHQYSANIAQQQKTLVVAQMEQKQKHLENCEKIRILEKVVADSVTRAELTDSLALFSQKLDFLRQDMTAFNIKILEYLRDNNTNTRRE